jgi:hypothetical protein
MLALSLQLAGAAKMVQIVAGQQSKSLETAPNEAFFITDWLCLIVTDVSHANGKLAVSVQEAVEVRIGKIILRFKRLPNMLYRLLIEHTDSPAGDAGVKASTLPGFQATRRFC